MKEKLTYHGKMGELITQLKQMGAKIGEPVPHEDGFFYPIDFSTCNQEMLELIEKYTNETTANTDTTKGVL